MPLVLENVLSQWINIFSWNLHFLKSDFIKLDKNLLILEFFKAKNLKNLKQGYSFSLHSLFIFRFEIILWFFKVSLNEFWEINFVKNFPCTVKSGLFRVELFCNLWFILYNFGVLKWQKNEPSLWFQDSRYFVKFFLSEITK